MRNVTVLEGSPAQFRTQVSGKPQPTVAWYREGLLIPQSADFQVSSTVSNPLFYPRIDLFIHGLISLSTDRFIYPRIDFFIHESIYSPTDRFIYTRIDWIYLPTYRFL